MVAMAASIAAVYPHMNHIGGDGFWLVREPNKRVRAIMAAGPAGAAPRRGFIASTRRNPVARAARRADRAGRGRRLDAGGRGGAARRRQGLPLDVLLHAAIGQARDGYAVTRSQARLTTEKLAGA